MGESRCRDGSGCRLSRRAAIARLCMIIFVGERPRTGMV